MTTLTDYALHYGTDKAWHGYTDIYEELFKPFRRKPIKLLEIGVAGGESIRMWCDWFHHPDTVVVGIDIQDRNAEVPTKAHITITDACSPNAVFDIANAYAPFDIIVEDASHYTKHQKTLLDQWFPHLKPGGIWVTEDTHSGWHYPWNDEGETPFVHSLENYIDAVNEKGKDQCGKPTDSLIEYITFRKSLVIIKKR